MSAWGIGSVTATRRQAGAADAAPQTPPVASVDTLITWIPGEVIAAYAAIVLALQPEQGSAPEPPPVEITSKWWVVAAVIFAGLLTWLGGWSKSDELDGGARKELAVRVILAGVAFAIWSFVVPGGVLVFDPRLCRQPDLDPDPCRDRRSCLLLSSQRASSAVPPNRKPTSNPPDEDRRGLPSAPAGQLLGDLDPRGPLVTRAPRGVSQLTAPS